MVERAMPLKSRAGQVMKVPLALWRFEPGADAGRDARRQPQLPSQRSGTATIMLRTASTLRFG